MSIIDLFSTESDTIDISGLDTLISLCKYQPHHPDNFLKGIILAKDLVSEKGVTLYTTGTAIIPERIARLVEIQAMNPKRVMEFQIKRSAELVGRFKQEILKRVNNLLNFRTRYKVYTKLIGCRKEQILEFFDDFLNDESRVLTAYKMQFITESSPNKHATVFFNHGISVATLSYALAQTPEIQENVTLSPEEQSDLVSSALFCSIGAISHVDGILKKEKKEQPALYNTANRESFAFLKGVKLSQNSITGMKYIIDYKFGAQDFVTQQDDTISWIANIITVIDQYLQTESGLFGERDKISHIVDNLNIAGMRNKVNMTVVKALTVTLQFTEIFDFYLEMEELHNMCTFSGGKHALPYPMTGFKSPTLFVCKNHINDCNYFETSLKAVTIVQPTEDLVKGKYARCTLTTPRLLEFYKKHYSEIKEDTREKIKVKK